MYEGTISRIVFMLIASTFLLSFANMSAFGQEFTTYTKYDITFEYPSDLSIAEESGDYSTGSVTFSASALRQESYAPVAAGKAISYSPTLRQESPTAELAAGKVASYSPSIRVLTICWEEEPIGIDLEAELNDLADSFRENSSINNLDIDESFEISVNGNEAFAQEWSFDFNGVSYKAEWAAFTSSQSARIIIIGYWAPTFVRDEVFDHLLESWSDSGIPAGGLPSREEPGVPTLKRVLFDETRPIPLDDLPGSFHLLIDDYDWYGASEFADLLRENGYEVSKLNGKPITIEKLRGYDVLVILSASAAESYSAEEADSIEEFVGNGGGLLLNVNPWYGSSSIGGGVRVADRLGVSYADNGQLADEINNCYDDIYNIIIYDISAHPITSYVEEINVDTGTYIRDLDGALVLATTSYSAWFDRYYEDWGNMEKDYDEYYGLYPVLVAMDRKNGRAVFTTGYGFSNDEIEYADNRQLAFNIINWLAGAKVTSTSKILFSDDFSDENSGWGTFSDEYGQATYRNGRLYIEDVTDDWFIYSECGRHFTDFILEVDTMWVGGTDYNWHTVTCRCQDEENLYTFGISADGYYFIDKSVNGDLIEIVQATESDYIRQERNAVNRIRVECIGSDLRLLVNGHLLSTVTDYTFTEGDIGLGAESLGDSYTEVAYDNLVVTEP